MLIKIVIALCVFALAAFFFLGFQAAPDLTDKVLFGGASGLLFAISILIIFSRD